MGLDADGPLGLPYLLVMIRFILAVGLLATGCASATHASNAPPSTGATSFKAAEKAATDASSPPPSTNAPLSPPPPPAEDSIDQPAAEEKERVSRERVAGIGAATSTGGRIVDMVKVVAGMTPGFTRCYNTGLRQDPDMAGSVRVIAKVGPKGRVLSAAPSGGDGLSTAVIACIIRVVEAATFSPPEGGNATITIPIAMSQ
jgi:hypothetical protein